MAASPLPPTVWSHDGPLKDDAHDPDAARKLLDEAGVTSLEMKLWAMPVARPYAPIRVGQRK